MKMIATVIGFIILILIVLFFLGFLAYLFGTWIKKNEHDDGMNYERYCEDEDIIPWGDVKP